MTRLGNGVLKVTLPRTPGAGPKTIEVNVKQSNSNLREEEEMTSIVSFVVAAALLGQAEPKGPGNSEGSQESQERRGFSLTIAADGKVEMTVRRSDPSTGKLIEKTYKADSVEEFRKKYPDVAKEYRVDRVVGEPAPDGKGDPGKLFEEWKKRFDHHWFWDRDGDFEKWFKELPKGLESDELGKWFEEQRKLFEKFRRIPPPDSPEGAPKSEAQPRSFGILIAPVGDTLAHQLGLDPTQGVIVAEVKKGSIADKAGLRKNDIVVKLNDRIVEGTTPFRKAVYDSFEKGFTLEILRRGKRETLKVEPEK